MKTLSFYVSLSSMTMTLRYAGVLLALLISCKIDREKTIDRSRFSFKITADSHLFFKNVRQVYYDFTDLQEAGWHAYRLSNRYQSNNYPVINTTIVIDWRKDEAYLLVEGNSFLDELPELVIQEKNPVTGITYSYQLTERGKENMLEFATKIYEGIMAENEFAISINGDLIPFFQEDSDRENFRIVMADYYRLTRIIR